MRYLLHFFFLSLLLLTESSYAQYYETGQDPASLKWMQIKTERFTVIYPEKYEDGGVAFASSLDKAYSSLLLLYPESKFNIPVIIHNYSTKSNGYVSWAPRRIEIYPTPEQNTIPLDPISQLSIHELTHVFQLQSLNKGFSKAISLLLGEQFTGITASLLPLWFFEGNAVFAESVLTESGRGRIPSFQKQLKAIIVEQDNMFNYDKIVNGSYRDNVPNHYHTGYEMATWGMAKYDLQMWNKVLDFTAKQPFTLNPVNISLTKNYGLKKKTLYLETFDSLRTIWTEEVRKNNSVVYESLNPNKKNKYINYYSPLIVGHDSIIAIKTSLSDPPVIVLINKSKLTEKRLHTPGKMFPWQISYGNGKIVWVETQSDPRWENRDYSVIRSMDLSSMKITRLSRKSRYLSASVSPDGKRIATIENTISNKNNLVFIDAVSGSLLQSVPAPENAYLQRPQWSEEGGKITVISLTEKGEGVMSYTLSNQKWETLIKAGRDDLQSTFLRNDSLFYVSSRPGTDNVYLQTADGKNRKLTNSRFGIIDLYVEGNILYFSDYNSLGNDICSTTIDNMSPYLSEKSNSSSFLINRFDIEPLSQENTNNTIYKPEPYKKWQHLFKFHSWLPFYADIEEIKADPTAISPGISLMTQNELSTLISTLGYEYYNKRHNLHSRVTWKGWYPVFESQLDYGDDPQIFKSGVSVGDPSELSAGIRFSNTVSLPLQFSSGKFSQYIRPSITTDYQNKYIFLEKESTYDYGQTIISGRIFVSNYYKYAMRDIYPRWAQVIDLNYTYAPFDREIYGSAISIKTLFYFPGFLPNNGIKIRLEKEKQTSLLYMFGNRVSFPRGYKNIISQDIELYSADYVIPVTYPDFNIASILYLKRIRTGLFYDYAQGTGNTYFNYSDNGLIADSFHDYQESFRSFGLELLADFHILRIPFMISGGVQAAWKDINKSPSYELLLNIDLFGMTIGKNYK